jgi:hypothetical protein
LAARPSQWAGFGPPLFTGFCFSQKSFLIKNFIKWYEIPKFIGISRKCRKCKLNCV